MELIFMAVTFLACLVGTVCGMGGGVIIKPVMDAFGTMSIATINFMSGCTVIAMTCWSLGKTFLKKESVVELRNTTVLAIAAALGGLLGKELFNRVAGLFPNPNTAGGVQACLLLGATLATFVYTIKKDNIQPKQVTSLPVVFLLGFLLGILGAFLGIGGGPFNVAVFCYFFSMQTKKAAQNSLYVVLFSQLASTGKTFITSGVPELSTALLLGMMIVGILGSEAGRKLNHRLDNKKATYMFEGVMILIMGICIYNGIKYLA